MASSCFYSFFVFDEGGRWLVLRVFVWLFLVYPPSHPQIYVIIVQIIIPNQLHTRHNQASNDKQPPNHPPKQASKITTQANRTTTPNVHPPQVRTCQ